MDKEAPSGGVRRQLPHGKGLGIGGTSGWTGDGNEEGIDGMVSADIVERLRDFADDYTTTYFHDALVREAADEIDMLRAEVERLRDALFIQSAQRSDTSEQFLRHELDNMRRLLEEEKAVADERAQEVNRLKLAAPLCDEHKPNGGARPGCLVCSLRDLSAALSRIDYLCGEPNEMGVSGYDLHCDEDAVVKHIEERLRSRTVTLPPLGAPPVGALTDGEVSMLRQWAERYASAALRAAGVEIK